MKRLMVIDDLGKLAALIMKERKRFSLAVVATPEATCRFAAS